MTVLIVEDEPLMAAYLQSELESGGGVGDPPVAVLSAKNRAEAMATLRDQEVDLVLLDVGLPDSSGLDSVAAMLDVAPEVPVVVVTGSDDEYLGDRSLRAGAVGFLPKTRAEGRAIWEAVRHGLIRAERYAVVSAQVESARRADEEALLIDSMSASHQVSHDALGIASLRERSPLVAQQLVMRYADLVVEAGDAGWRSSIATRALAHDLGALRAHPRDVTDVHVAAMQQLVGSRSSIESTTLLARSRGTLAQVLGELASYYLTQLAGVDHRPATSDVEVTL